MAHRPYEPVLHCTAKQPNKALNLGNKVITGLTANTAIYPSPNPTVASLTTEVNKLAILQGNVRGGGKEATAKRDAQSKKVFDMLSTEKLYVKITAGNDKDKILLSGFDVNVQPSPSEVPDKLSIRNVINGPFVHSAKILLGKFKNPAQMTRVRLNFIVEMTTDPSKEENWDDELHTSNSKKLIIEDLVRKTEYFFRVTAENAKGRGIPSDPVSFIAQ